MQSDTIAAISTGMTNAGIGKVRLSGDDAVTIVDRIYRSPGGRKRLSDAVLFKCARNDKKLLRQRFR